MYKALVASCLVEVSAVRISYPSPMKPKNMEYQTPEDVELTIKGNYLFLYC